MRKESTKMLNDRVLKKVAGGINIVEGNSHEEEREYFVGDRVEIYVFLWFTKSATIIGKNGTDGDFIYTVRYADGGTEDVKANDIQK